MDIKVSEHKEMIVKSKFFFYTELMWKGDTNLYGMYTVWIQLLRSALKFDSEIVFIYFLI